MSHCPLDEGQERTQLPSNRGPVWSCSAVPGKFEVDGRRQSISRLRHDSEEVPSLLITAGAEGEEVISAPAQSGRHCIGPVLGEPAVDEVSALRRLYVGEGDVVLDDAVPLDPTLMVGHVDPVPFSFAKARSVAWKPREPAPSYGDRENDRDGACQNRPPPRKPPASILGAQRHSHKPARNDSTSATRPMGARSPASSSSIREGPRRSNRSSTASVRNRLSCA